MDSEILHDTYSFDSNNPEILILSIDIGDGRKDILKVHEKDNFEQLALDFCTKYRLGAKTKIMLQDQIEKKITANKLNLKSKAKNNQFELSSSQTRPDSAFCELVESPLKEPLKNQRILSSDKKNKTNTKTSKNLPSKTRTLWKNSNWAKKKFLNKDQNTGTVGFRNEKFFADRSKLLLHKKNLSQETLKENPKMYFKNSTRNLSPYKIECKQPNDFLNDFKSKSPSPKLKSLIKSPQIDKSQFYLKKIKEKRYKEIFEGLLPDGKGIISKETVEKSEIHEEIRGIIFPLLEELAIMDETLNFQEFFDAMELLMKTLTPTEKHLILMTGKQRSEEFLDSNHKPNISKNQKYGSPINLYERGLLQKKETWKRIMHEKEEKEKIEMKECIFQPNAHKKAISTGNYKEYLAILSKNKPI